MAKVGAIITNGSKIVVPEGTALVTFQDGAVTGMIAEPGGYIWNSEDPNSQSMFAGDGIFGQTLPEKVKFSYSESDFRVCWVVFSPAKR